MDIAYAIATEQVLNFETIGNTLAVIHGFPKRILPSNLLRKNVRIILSQQVVEKAVNLSESQIKHPYPCILSVISVDLLHAQRFEFAISNLSREELIDRIHQTRNQFGSLLLVEVGNKINAYLSKIVIAGH